MPLVVFSWGDAVQSVVQERVLLHPPIGDPQLANAGDAMVSDVAAASKIAPFAIPLLPKNSVCKNS